MPEPRWIDTTPPNRYPDSMRSIVAILLASGVLSGCALGAATPPIDAQVAVTGAVDSESGEVAPASPIRVGINPLQVWPEVHDRHIDFGGGVQFNAYQYAPPSYYLDAGVMLGQRRSPSESSAFGPRLSRWGARLKPVFISDGFGGLAQLTWDRSVFVGGRLGHCNWNDEKVSGACSGSFASGETGMGAFVEAGYYAVDDREFWTVGGGVSVKLPSAGMGFAGFTPVFLEALRGLTP